MLLRDEIDFGFLDAPAPSGIRLFFDPAGIRLWRWCRKNSPYADMEVVPLSVYNMEATALYDEGSQKRGHGDFSQKIKIIPRVEYTSRDDNLILSLIENSLCIGYMGQLILTKNSYRVVSRFTEPQFYRGDHVCSAQHRKRHLLPPHALSNFLRITLPRIIAYN